MPLSGPRYVSMESLERERERERERFDLANNLKMAKYTELIEEAREKQYTSNLITLEVGSHGPFHLLGFKVLQSHFTIPSKEVNALQMQITRRVIIEYGSRETAYTLRPATLSFRLLKLYLVILICM